MSKRIWLDDDETTSGLNPITEGILILAAICVCCIAFGVVLGAAFDGPVMRALGW